MKICTIIATATLGCVLSVTAAFAQTAQQDLQQYISSHPELQQNPGLMNNPTYRANHPDLNRFLQNHPQVDRQRYGNGGAYGHNGGWRDGDWRHQNDPQGVAANHPDWNHSHWAQGHPNYRPHDNAEGYSYARSHRHHQWW
jgi:hypothetical protein